MQARFFLNDPVIPETASERHVAIGTIKFDGASDEGGFHEFQTKKRRREAKVSAHCSGVSHARFMIAKFALSHGAFGEIEGNNESNRSASAKS